MTTTTGRDLLARAERLTSALARSEQPVDLAGWESFDTTAYRLLREVIGPARSDAAASSRTHVRLLHVIHSYPTPLRPPLDVELSARAAARFSPLGGSQFHKRVERGEIKAERTLNGYSLDSRELDRRPDITPADPTDEHPLARLTTTLGVLADLVSQGHRARRNPEALGDEAAVDITARILSYAYVAARYTLQNGRAVDGDRPLAIAQYAERFVDTLDATSSVTPLNELAARVESGGGALHERLDTALQHWAAITNTELSRTIPATPVMANAAELGAMMLAAMHHLDRDVRGVSSGPTTPVRPAAEALMEAAASWKTVTTLQPQTREFGNASLELFKVMRELLETSSTDWRGAHAADALRNLHMGINDLTRFMARSTEVTQACLNSGVLFAPARALPLSHQRLIERRRGSHVSITPLEGRALLAPVRALPHTVDAIRDHQRPSLDPEGVLLSR